MNVCRGIRDRCLLLHQYFRHYLNCITFLALRQPDSNRVVADWLRDYFPVQVHDMLVWNYYSTEFTYRTLIFAPLEDVRMKHT